MSRVYDPAKDKDERVRCGTGTHIFRIVKTKGGYSQQKGTRFIEIMAKVIDGPFKGAFVRDTVYITDSTWPRVVTLLAASGAGVVDVDNDEQVWKGLVGRTLQITIKEEPYESKKDHTTKMGLVFEYWGFKPVDKTKYQDEPAPAFVVDPDEAQGGARAQGGGGAPPTAPIDDDDLPF